jgi:hypothetical protein
MVLSALLMTSCIFFKPRRSAIKQAWQLADAFLIRHPDLKNEFGERPWLDPKPQPNKKRGADSP